MRFTTIDPILHFIVKAAARVVLAPFFELRVQGQDHIPRKGPLILLPKHQRWEDIPLLGLASPVPLYYVAKKELFTHRLSSRFMRALGGIPLDRRRPMASRNSIKEIVGLLKGEAAVVVFPEGTYYKNRMGSGYAGLIRLIHSRIDVPFIPVGIRYARKGVRIRADIAFGRSIPWGLSAAPDAFLAAAMAEIKALSGL